MKERINRPLFYASLFLTSMVVLLTLSIPYGYGSKPMVFTWTVFTALVLYIFSLAFTLSKEDNESPKFIWGQLSAVLLHAYGVLNII